MTTEHKGGIAMALSAGVNVKGWQVVLSTILRLFKDCEAPAMKKKKGREEEREKKVFGQDENGGV